MGGWSGGVYTRFRNWVSDKANSINPQAALFDQEDDGFAAGLNNCLTKDGLNKPSSAMDWNGQSLTGVLNFANTGTVSLANGKLTISVAGNVVGAAPTSGNALALTGFAGSSVANFTSGSAAGASVADVNVSRAGSTINTIEQGPCVVWNDTTNTTSTSLQHSGGQTELWQFNAGWRQIWRITTAAILQVADSSGTMQDVGYKRLIYRSLSGNYTAVLADDGANLCNNSASPFTFTIPSNVSVPYALGATLTFSTVNGGGAVTIAITTDTLILAGTGSTGSRTLATTGVATATKVANTQWLISGAGLT